MTAKPIVPRQLARLDVEAAVDHYASEAGDRIATGFITALENAWQIIADHPAAGSPRYERDLNLPGLRSFALSRYPFVVFYIEHEDHIDIWRVLHAQRDIPASMRGADG